MSTLPSTSEEVTHLASVPVEATGLAALGVDGPLLLVQAINFFLLLGLLWWLLYQPLLGLLAARRQTIAEGLAAAYAQKESAESAAKEREQILATARADAAQLLVETKAILKEERAQAQAELAAKRQEFEVRTVKELAGQRTKLIEDVRQSVATLVAQALEKILGDREDHTKDWQPLVTKTLKELE